MKQSLTKISFVLTGLIALGACTKPAMNDSTGIDALETKTSSIVNGTPVAADDDIAKSTVQIYTLIAQTDAEGNPARPAIAGCTGSIIAEDTILTAAHCTTWDPSNIFLVFSPKTPANLRESLAKFRGHPLMRQVTSGQVPNLWPRLTEHKIANWGDIAVLHFKGGLPAGYKVAELLPSHAVLKEKQPLVLAGFGITDGIKQTRTTELLKVDVSILKPDFSKSEMMIDSGTQGPCHGDSGGPAYVNFAGHTYISGVTSRADLDTDPGGLCIGETIYTKVQPYLFWIHQSMKALREPSYVKTEIPQPQGE